MRRILALTAVCALVGLALATTPTLTAISAGEQAPAAAQASVDVRYDYAREAALAAKFNLDDPDPNELRRVFRERRERVLAAIPEFFELLQAAVDQDSRRAPGKAA